MKKLLKLSLNYAILAMVCGVFYREFTKINHFEGVTTLSKVHGHLFMLGMFVFLLLALFSQHLDFDNSKIYQRFLIIYNGGVVLTAIMMIVRGVMQVKQVALTSAMNAAISGIAGIGHIMVGVGIVLFIQTLRKAC